MSPKQARKFGSKVMGYGLLVVGALFSVKGNFAFGLPMLGIGAGMAGYGNFSLAPRPSARASSSPPVSSNMDQTEAYDVLGLQPGATRDEINAAYKRLQRANHPDTGGSTYLAAKINQARDLLLRG
jgi:DnaJ family protein C protein 19